MLIMTNGDNKMKMKRDNVRIIRIILGSHGVIVDSRKIVLFEYEKQLPTPWIKWSLCRNMFCKLKSFVVFFKLLTSLLLSRPFYNIFLKLIWFTFPFIPLYE